MSQKVTIVTVTYNCVNDVEKTLLSVLSQDYPNLEYIVVDGASTDGTLELIKKYRTRINVLVSEPDTGIYHAMNKALNLASGRWCGFLNAGDYYADEKVISTLFEGTTEEDSLRVIYGNTKYILASGDHITHSTSTIDRFAWTISRYQPYTHQAVFYNITQKTDCLYDLRYRIAADYDVACRYWKRYGIEAYRYVPITVCYYKAFDGLSSLPQNQKRIRKEQMLIKLRNHLSFIEVLKDFVNLLLK